MCPMVWILQKPQQHTKEVGLIKKLGLMILPFFQEPNVLPEMSNHRLGGGAASNKMHHNVEERCS